jgi:hypothetical protein
MSLIFPQFSKDHKSDWKMMKTSSRITVSKEMQTKGLLFLQVLQYLQTFSNDKEYILLCSLVFPVDRDFKTEYTSTRLFAKWLQHFRGLYKALLTEFSGQVISTPASYLGGIINLHSFTQPLQEKC